MSFRCNLNHLKIRKLYQLSKINILQFLLFEDAKMFKEDNRNRMITSLQFFRYCKSQVMLRQYSKHSVNQPKLTSIKYLSSLQLKYLTNNILSKSNNSKKCITFLWLVHQKVLQLPFPWRTLFQIFEKGAAPVK